MRNGIDSLLLVAILSAAVSLKSCEGNAGLDGSLRRKRIANAYEVQDHRKALADSEFMLKPEEHLEDLWSRGTTVDEDQWVLKDRYLQFSLSLSMATRPPTPPRPTTPRPTPAPTLPGNGTFAPTSAPSFNSTDCLEGNTREQYVLNVLSSITDLALLQNASTPQGAAYSWLAFEDLETDVCEPFIERYGLATFYYSTSGDTWINNADWLSALDVCEWFGVTCDHITNSTVERLQLPLNSVFGPIPNEIFTLPELLRIDLFGNFIFGTLPAGLAGLTRLELLDLEENAITGLFFTPEILSLTSLVGLRGSFNGFIGTIPPDISRLTRLEQLWAADNSLFGTIPFEITTLTSLESFFLYSNTLSGSIPAGFGGLVNFTQIRLYDNQLEGSIPEDLFQATLLDTIRLDSNALTGTISTAIGNLLLLADLRLDNNTMFGPIPSEVGNLLLLENLILHDNFFSGTLSDSLFSGLSSMVFVDISNNIFLGGSLPTTFFEMPSIKNVYIANCSLTGTIPANFGTPPALRDLYLDGNLLVGTVPEISFGQLTMLNEFLLQNNMLTGSMPASVCALRDNTTGILEDLWSDCLVPEIECEFPSCCNRCF